ncbi:MAG: BREX system P-loop protein BrxC [Acidobacteriota bacterium]
MTIREIIKRDIGVKIEGVVKVFDRAALASEFREYVVTDKIEDELKRIFDTFTQVSDTLRRGGRPRDVMGIWVSGFFGSGKSHFAKVLGYLLQNDDLGDGSGERCSDVFLKHLSDSPRGREIRLRLGEIKQTTEIKTLAFEIRSRQALNNPSSVGEILLGEFYRSIGLSENFIVARIERRLARRNLLVAMERDYESTYGVPWKSAEGRDDLMTVRRRLAEILPRIDSGEWADVREAKKALDDAFRHEKITPEGIADELVAWVEEQKTTGGRVQHLVFVVDEMGSFIGDSGDKISEVNSLAEMIGNKGKGKVWLICTSQLDLEKVVDRTNFQPALVGRLNARFELKPQLISDEINKVVAERILKKHPSEEEKVRALYQEGYIAQLADLKASRHLGTLSERTFINCYPLLPHQIRLAQDIFEAIAGFRVSGGVRSMITVVMETLQDVADDALGSIVSFDMIFDAVENDLLSQEYLGASGVRSIRESFERVPGTPIDPARILKILWLLQKVAWVPRVPETLAKLLVRDLNTEIPPLRAKVEQTLDKLQEAGYVARDEATGEWKFLNEKERTIEQAIQEMVRPGGPKSISVAAVRRTSQEMAKTDLVTKRKLANFTVSHGATKATFPYGVYLDGESVETGPELELHFVGPLAPGRKQTIDEVRQQNQSAGTKGRRVCWLAATPENLETRFKRYEALVKVTSDKRFTEDSSADTQDALSEKRKERDDLRTALVKDLEKAFLAGTLFYGGQEQELDGVTDFKEPVQTALSAIIPNIYASFGIADRTCDFARQLKAILNPATTALHTVAPELDLFDTQGSLQQQSALVAQVLEVIADLEDEDVDPAGTVLIEAPDRKGFRGFERPPFGWSSELVRLVLAACFRAGAIYVERPTPSGPTPLYDYKDSYDLFAKINTFKHVTFRVAETRLAVDQIKRANKELIAMGVTGTPESGNAIAAAVRKLGEALMAGISEAKSHADRGLPVRDAVLGGKTALTEPTTAKDPTKVVTAFLARADEWKALNLSLEALRAFLADQRHHEYDISRRIAELATNHPVDSDHGSQPALSRSLKDMDAIIAEKSVVERWSDYRLAYDNAHRAYRDAYRDTYTQVQSETETVVSKIRNGSAYKAAPAATRDGIVDKVFGPGGPCHYPTLAMGSASSLLDAAARRSLSSLAQARVALPGYQDQVENALRALAAPPPAAGEKVWEWRVTSALAGQRFQKEAEVDAALQQAGDQIKAQIRQGYTVVVK